MFTGGPVSFETCSKPPCNSCSISDQSADLRIRSGSLTPSTPSFRPSHSPISPVPFPKLPRDLVSMSDRSADLRVRSGSLTQSTPSFRPSHSPISPILFPKLAHTAVESRPDSLRPFTPRGTKIEKSPKGFRPLAKGCAAGATLEQTFSKISEHQRCSESARSPVRHAQLRYPIASRFQNPRSNPIASKLGFRQTRRRLLHSGVSPKEWYPRKDSNLRPKD